MNSTRMPKPSLEKKVIEFSKAQNWEDASKEWNVVDCHIDESQSGICLCGKHSLKYLYTIKNKNTDKELFPIGSDCIHLFDNDEMSYDANELEVLSLLKHEIKKGKFIQKKNLSRTLLTALYDYKFLNYQDYDFMLDMFNKRNEMTYRQKKKFNAIVYYQIVLPMRNNKNFRSLHNRNKASQNH